MSWRRNLQALAAAAEPSPTRDQILVGMAVVVAFVLIGFWMLAGQVERSDARRAAAEKKLQARITTNERGQR